METWQNKLNRQMETIGWGKFQYIAFIVCFSVRSRQAWINENMWMIGLSFILYVQTDEWGLDSASIGMYLSIVFLGEMIGCYFWSYIADRYGRMKSFKTQIFLLFFGAFGMSSSISLAMLVPFALVMGFAKGGELALAGTVYKEFIPASYSSTLGILLLGFNSGTLIVDILAMMTCDLTLPVFAGWRWMFIVMLVIEVGFIAIRMKLPETPFFLASKGRMEEAEAVLNQVRSSQISLTNEKGCLKESLLNADEDLSAVSAHPKQETNGAQITRLFSKELIQPTLTLGAFCFMNDIALIGVLMFMPQILAKVGSGVQTCQSAYMTSAIQQTTCIPACLIAWKLLDTSLGRRWSIVIFTAASGVLMSSLFLVQDLAEVRPIQVIVVSSLCIALNYMGWSGLFTMLPETYPTEIRSTGAGWVSFNLKVASLITPVITGVLLESAGVVPVVTTFAVLMIASGLVGIAMKETKGSNTM
jgi:putative MFS transporter